MEKRFKLAHQLTVGAVTLGAAFCGLAAAISPVMAQSPYDNVQEGSSFTKTNQIEPGTSIKVIDLDPISSSTNQIGDTVRVRVAPDDTSGLSKSIIFVGHIRRIDSANNNTGGDIGIRFDSLEAVGDWQAIAPPANGGPALATVHFVASNGATGGKDDVAIGAGVGALIGGSRKRKLGDTVEGGLLGALGGLIVQKATTHNGYDVSLHAGDETTIILKRPLTVKTELFAS